MTAGVARVDSVAWEQLPAFRWLKVGKLRWTDERGRSRAWETADRTTRGAAGVDGVCVIARLAEWERAVRSAAPERTVLVSQFRPPVGQYVLELPAGLVDAAEAPATAAARELKEETGFVASDAALAFARQSPVVPCDPGASGSNMQVITVKVDTSLPENQNPKDEQEDGECIERHIVPCGGPALLESLEELSKTRGMVPDARLWMYAAGRRDESEACALACAMRVEAVRRRAMLAGALAGAAVAATAMLCVAPRRH